MMPVESPRLVNQVLLDFFEKTGLDKLATAHNSIKGIVA
ncbi:hypothetical protein ALO43_200612 [Pseudomonas tremae]|nr:hypothetical protein ALO43_200612 [Pseudomonas tremae]